jgi:hypothetical protein
MSDLLNSASLVLIPSGYKEDTVYSVVPSDGSGDLSFTRASNGTRVNSAGLVEVCPWNLLQYSETFDTSWTTSNVTITANDTTAPNGTTTAEKALCASGSSISPNIFYSAGINCENGQIYNYSYYAKKGSTNFAKIRFSGTAFASVANSPIFNLNTGAIVSGTGTIQDVGNGWYRISATATAESSASGVVTVDIPSSTGVWPNGNFAGTEFIYIWGAQLNIGSTAKPYFPTTDRLNVPRLTYQNGGGGCPSLLLEKQSTNLVTYSEQFDDAAWTKVLSTITANDTTSPDGTQNADLLTTTNTGICYIYQLLSGTSGAYSASMYVKNGNNNYFALNVQGSTGNWAVAIFDLTNGSLGQYAQGANGGFVYVNHTITNVGNGWYRCVLNYTTTQSTYFCPMFAPLKTGNSFSAAYGEAQNNANNKTMYVWGAQVEASSYPTSYIPTTSASATRIADSCFKTGISSLFGTNQGTFFIDFVYYGSEQFSYLFDVTDSSNVNRFLMYDSNGSGLFYFYDSGYSQITTVQFTKGQRYKIAVKYNSSGTIWYVNGVLSATGTVSFALQMAQVYLGIRYSLTDNTGMQVNQTIVFPTALTSTELVSLTTI